MQDDIMINNKEIKEIKDHFNKGIGANYKRIPLFR